GRGRAAALLLALRFHGGAGEPGGGAGGSRQDARTGDQEGRDGRVGHRRLPAPARAEEEGIKAGGIYRRSALGRHRMTASLKRSLKKARVFGRRGLALRSRWVRFGKAAGLARARAATPRIWLSLRLSQLQPRRQTPRLGERGGSEGVGCGYGTGSPHPQG